MSENERPQNDFFSDLMFGRTKGPPQSAPPEVTEPEETKEEESSSLDIGQLAQILTIVETIGVTVERLTPLIDIAQTFIRKKKEDKTSITPKKETPVNRESTSKDE